MMGETIGLEKASKSGAAIADAYLLVTFGADEDHVVVASFPGDVIIGIAQHTTVAAEETVRVALGGISRCKIDQPTQPGDLITVSGSGRGTPATPGAGVNNYVIGIALAAGTFLDVIPVLIVPGRIQG